VHIYLFIFNITSAQLSKYEQRSQLLFDASIWPYLSSCKHLATSALFKHLATSALFKHLATSALFKHLATCKPLLSSCKYAGTKASSKAARLDLHGGLLCCLPCLPLMC
jgi:hypothetical protein